MHTHLRTHLRQANDHLAQAWAEAKAAGKLGKARKIAAAWRIVEALVEDEEQASRTDDQAA